MAWVAPSTLSDLALAFKLGVKGRSDKMHHTSATLANSNNAAKPAAPTNKLATLEGIDDELIGCRSRKAYWRKREKHFTEPGDLRTVAGLIRTFDEKERNLLELRRLLTTPCSECGKVLCQEVAA